ncbi:uncharacterized protein TNCV_4886001 [Trichonephila clavipes]|uniref:Uncharacterized protein n=1 Tax=Trichonephila clavipes TaxID=2585209 RepID=A0A8X6RN74_TRICX|nr:uncharacterized protein TNCV_4886001 [Trichonephila clavipes]
MDVCIYHLASLQHRSTDHNEKGIYRVSPNAVYKLGGVVENIVRSQNYIGKHGRKAIGGAVRELARERYPTRRQPNHQTFARVHQNLVERGSFRATIEGTIRRRIARTPIFEEGVLHAVDQTPGTSVRALAASTGKSPTTIHRVL